MAKVLAPLLSFGASGQIAKAVVHFPWKGVNAVREYVIPANPRTTLQKAQRDRMEAAVDEWHGASYNAGDIIAWNRYASTLAKIMSGFNAMIQEHILQAILGNVWTRIYHGGSYAVTATSFKAGCSKAAGGTAPVVHWGCSKTSMPSSHAMGSIGGDDWEYPIPNLTADTLYYFTIDVGTSPADYGRLGVYSQRTLAA